MKQNEKTESTIVRDAHDEEGQEVKRRNFKASQFKHNLDVAWNGKKIVKVFICVGNSHFQIAFYEYEIVFFSFALRTSKMSTA